MNIGSTTDRTFMVGVSLPDKVKIGWKLFRVEAWDPDVAAATGRFGECDHVKSVIRVDVSHSARQVAETLIHECLHAMMAVSGANEAPGARRDQYEEEHVVATLGSGLLTLAVDNPEVWDFISWAAKTTDEKVKV